MESSDEFIGPAPPTPHRGRGSVSASAAMDARFRDNYDFKNDFRCDSPEGKSWDDTVEDYRDRQKWKQQGADRLRSAGFDESFITAWKTNSCNDEGNLKWSKKGDTREWDKGKTIER